MSNNISSKKDERMALTSAPDEGASQKKICQKNVKVWDAIAFAFPETSVGIAPVAGEF